MSAEQAKKYFEIGLQFFKDKKLDLAQFNFEEALKLSPNRPSILQNLALVYFLRKNYTQANEVLKNLENQNFFNDDLRELKFKILRNLKKTEELSEFLNNNKNFTDSSYFYKTFNELTYPDFFYDQSDIDQSRKKIDESLERLLNDPFKKLNLDKEVLEPPIFNLSYDQYDNLNINKKIVTLFRKIYPQLNQTLVSDKKNEKIKIGFFSEFFYDHTIGKLFKGIIFKLDRSIFDIVVFHSQNTKKNSIYNEFLDAEIKIGLKNVNLDKDFTSKISIIAKENLDIAFFPDIGMSTEFYYLSFVRFARIQVTSWGHPITTANTSIDYFLSSILLKSELDNKIFTEKILYLKNLPMYFYKPILNNPLIKKETISKNLYFCSQSMVKFHPHFDLILNKILSEDKKAKIYLIDNKKLGKKFKKRLKENINQNFDRINFLDRLSLENYINECGRASVLIDTLYFGAGNSFHESMTYGTPTVTLPTKNLKSRIVMGAYKQMQIEDAPICKDVDEYVFKATEIANFNANSILDLKHYYKDQADRYLFQNEELVEEINTLFIELYNKHEKTTL